MRAKSDDFPLGMFILFLLSLIILIACLIIFKIEMWEPPEKNSALTEERIKVGMRGLQKYR